MTLSRAFEAATAAATASSAPAREVGVGVELEDSPLFPVARTLNVLVDGSGAEERPPRQRAPRAEMPPAEGSPRPKERWRSPPAAALAGAAVEHTVWVAEAGSEQGRARVFFTLRVTVAAHRLCERSTLVANCPTAARAVPVVPVVTRMEHLSTKEDALLAQKARIQKRFKTTWKNKSTG